MPTTKPVTKPTKQRKMLFQAPDHIRHKHFASPLSPELRASHGARALPVRNGDTVRIMRGDHKGFEGKITRVDRRKYRIYVEGLTREKVDGTTIFLPIHPSKAVITNLNLDDKWRKQVLERKRKAPKISEEVAEKPSTEAVEEKVPKKKTKGRKRKTSKKTAEKKVEAERKKLEKVKKVRKKTRGTRKEENPKAGKTRAKRRTAKKKAEG